MPYDRTSPGERIKHLQAMGHLAFQKVVQVCSSIADLMWYPSCQLFELLDISLRDSLWSGDRGFWTVA